MDFQLDAAVPLLERTPAVLKDLLDGLPPEWTAATEGPDTWSPFDVIGHLIHGERTDWMPRVEHLLKHGEDVPFPPFDMSAHFAASRGKTLSELLATFADLRADSVRRLVALGLTPDDLMRRGRHPELGSVTLAEHLSTWVVHDLNHLVQISRVMARQYTAAVGPWRKYLRVVRPS